MEESESITKPADTSAIESNENITDTKRKVAAARSPEKDKNTETQVPNRRPEADASSTTKSNLAGENIIDALQEVRRPERIRFRAKITND